MNLDDTDSFQLLDSQNIYAQIGVSPAHLGLAFRESNFHELPMHKGYRQVVICAMGTSALAGELAVGYGAEHIRTPVWVHRDHYLPGWVQGAETLVIGISYSGDTLEVLSAFEQAVKRGCTCLVITSGGQLAGLAAHENFPVWNLPRSESSDSALATIFGYLVGLFSRIELLTDQDRAVDETVEVLLKQQESIRREIPVALNPAKRMAGQCVGRWVTIIGSGLLAPAALSWKIQINKMAKAGAQAEQIPEIGHNLLVSIEQPEVLRSQTLAIFLGAPCETPRNRKSRELIRRFFMLQGLPTDDFVVTGDFRLANLWTCLQFGDYMAYYLAMAYQVNPVSTPLIEAFKTALDGDQVT